MSGSNIPDDLKKAPTEDLKINPTDPETARLVKEFVSQKEGEDVDLQINEEGGNKKPRVEIRADETFDGGDPNQAMITEGFIPLKDVHVSDTEKELFLKAVLTDTPVRLPIILYDGKFKIEIRSRTTHEQRRCFDAVQKDQVDGIIPKDDIAMAVTRLHYYLAALMIERINNSLFSELSIPPGRKVEDDVKEMRDFVTKNLEGMGQVRWSSILNALRIFEHKIARLNTEAANEDFWKPHGSA